MKTKFGSTATLSSFTNDSASMNVLSMKGTRNLVHFVTTKLLRKKVRTNMGKQTIGYAACIIWDKLPLNLEELSVYQFSKQLKKLNKLIYC